MWWAPCSRLRVPYRLRIGDCVSVCLLSQPHPWALWTRAILNWKMCVVWFKVQATVLTGSGFPGPPGAPGVITPTWAGAQVTEGETPRFYTGGFQSFPLLWNAGILFLISIRIIKVTPLGCCWRISSVPSKNVANFCFHRLSASLLHHEASACLHPQQEGTELWTLISEGWACFFKACRIQGTFWEIAPGWEFWRFRFSAGCESTLLLPISLKGRQKVLYI